MYALDNDSGVQTMPEVKAKKFNHNEPRWFTEGGNGVAPSYPGADWFNIVQAELLGLLTAGGIEPNKTQLNQLTQAIQKVVQDKVNTAISGKANTQHNHSMSDISGLSNALGAKAPLISPALTGTPTAPTANQSTNNTQIATTAFVKAAIAALVGSAPSSLDTLNELATALNNNANFASTIVNQLSQKADKNILDALVGIPLPWMQANLPSLNGVTVLALNGQRFDKGRYPILAQRYPSGVLVDLRGEFIRGWDNGRNIDRGRQILSEQGDAIRNITGEFGPSDGGDGDYKGPFRKGGGIGWGGTLQGGRHKVSFDISRSVPTANENRPRNVAFQYICIAA
ncbi:phage tail protein [Pasteurella multocida]|uniref:phage tail protein n=1 Tax=Pasteurella multocida TaxID=747 RepID=UPI002931DE50|nr:phage tail protein [Pasteurella multocida]